MPERSSCAPRLMRSTDLRLRGQRAADDALAGALRQLHPLLAVAVLLAQALAGVRLAGAVVLAGFRHAVALLRGALLRIVRERRRSRARDQSADRRREDC